ncbi:MAG: hypothetical protein R3C14_22460 [Caldilineaceae bacterium]
MTVYLALHRTSHAEEWEYEYLDAYDVIVARRVQSHPPFSTLQGAYSLIIDMDANKIVSYFETVGAAEVTNWHVVTTLEAPKAEAGQLSVVQDLDDGQAQAYFTDATYRLFYTRLGEPIEPTLLTHIAIGEHLIVDLTSNGMIAGLWMLNLPPAIGEKHAAKR